MRLDGLLGRGVTWSPGSFPLSAHGMHKFPQSARCIVRGYYIIHARWFQENFSVDLLDLRLKHTVLGVLSSSAKHFWRKKFSREQIFAGTNFRKLAFDCENRENFCLMKISRYTVLRSLSVFVTSILCIDKPLVLGLSLIRVPITCTVVSR